MAEINTLTVAQEVADLLTDSGYPATAVKAETGRIVLSIDVLDDNDDTRSFRFLGGEVTR